jgi:hypothetical protein
MTLHSENKQTIRNSEFKRTSSDISNPSPFSKTLLNRPKQQLAASFTTDEPKQQLHPPISLNLQSCTLSVCPIQSRLSSKQSFRLPSICGQSEVASPPEAAVTRSSVLPFGRGSAGPGPVLAPAAGTVWRPAWPWP